MPKVKHGTILLEICDGGKHAGQLVVGMPKLYQDRLEQLVGLKYTPDRDEFTLPKTWTSFLSLRELALSIHWTITPSPEVKAWAETMSAQWKSLRQLSGVVTRREEKQGTWFAHQEDGAAWLNAGADIGVGRLLLDDTGCLAGDTVINVNRAGKGFRMTVANIVKRLNGEPISGPGWDQNIPTMIARADGGVIRLGRLEKAWCTGLKKTFTLTTDTGRTIRATADHPFDTPSGWMPLSDLAIGSLVNANVGRSQRGQTTPKAIYREVYGMQAHPNASHRAGRQDEQRAWKPQWSVPQHRLVVEADLNGLDYQVFVDKVQAGSVDGLVFLDKETHVHHRDHNHRNNDFANLQVLTAAEHHQLHCNEGKTNHVLEQVGAERVVSIVSNGEELTYDMRMTNEPHNFIANGFVVHNCGKTVTIIKALLDSNDPGPVLITCPENVMETGWAHAFARFAPHYRTLQIVGSVVQRRKALAEVKAGLWDVVIIGHSNLKSHTRFRAYPGIALKRCVKCGGPKLTTGKVDKNGKPMPDIDYHREVELRLISSPVDLDTGIPSDEPPQYRAVCRHRDCVWLSDGAPNVATAFKEAMVHARTGKKIAEVTEAQCQAHVKELNEIAWTTFIVDEAHRGMNATSQTAHAFWGVAKYGPNGPIPNHRRWPATGTPLSKRTDQVWSLLHLISPEHWPIKTDWVDYNCTMKHNFWSGNMEVTGLKPEREPEFQATFSAVTRRVLKDQVLDLPPLMRWQSLERRLRMGGAQLKAYQSMRDEMLLLVEEGLITADNAAQQAGRLSALATGTGYPDPRNAPGVRPQRMLLRTPSVKLDAVMEDLRSGEFDGHQIGMMFASFQALTMFRDALIEHKVIGKDDVSTIAGPMPKAEVDLAIKKFQHGDRRFVMFTYAKGAEGITLTAADVVFAVERSWNTIHNLQGVNRFHRIGSEKHKRVVVIDYVVGNSNELRQLTRLEQNAETFEQIVQDRQRLRAVFV